MPFGNWTYSLPHFCAFVSEKTNESLYLIALPRAENRAILMNMDHVVFTDCLIQVIRNTLVFFFWSRVAPVRLTLRFSGTQ